MSRRSMRACAALATIALAAGAWATPDAAAQGADVPRLELKRGGDGEDGVSGDAAAADAAEAFEITSAWRFIDVVDGDDPPALQGVMKMVRKSFQPEESARRIGLFALRTADDAIYEGVYNIKADGRSLVGTFWTEGEFNRGQIAGFLDLRLGEERAGRGTLTFVADGARVDVTAR